MPRETPKVSAICCTVYVFSSYIARACRAFVAVILNRPPPLRPRALAAARPSWVRSTMRSCSNSAIAASMWIYEDVGERLKTQVGDLGAHPYGDWIGTYGHPEFAASTESAKVIVDRLAVRSGPSTTERMHQAFMTASRYEWMFWDAAWHRQAWPV